MSEQAEAPVSEGSATQAVLKKSKVKTKSKESQVNPNDVLAVTAHDIENLSKDKAFEMADELFQTSGFNDFRLGGVLKVISEHKDWQEGYASFEAMIEDRYGIKYRKAMYLIEIYTRLVDNQIPWDKVKDLGWTKLQIVAKKLKQSNVDEWVQKAKALTALQLGILVRQKKGGGEEEGEGGEENKQPTSDITTMTFKLHPDQKGTVRSALDKCREEVGTDVDTVALETICIGYLGGSVSIKKVEEEMSLLDVLQKYPLEEVLAAFDKRFPDVQIEVAA